MEAFNQLSAIAAPLDAENMDTDQILPVRFLRNPRENGYAQYLFHDLRFEKDGAEKPDFILNQPPFRKARILVVASNFGCGSSREQAVFGLLDFGVRAVVGPGFGDIFFDNCFKNGILPIRTSSAVAAAWRSALHDSPEAKISIDLAKQKMAGPDGTSQVFQVDPFRKRCLLEGLDELALTLTHLKAVSDFESRYRAENSWLQSSP